MQVDKFLANLLAIFHMQWHQILQSITCGATYSFVSHTYLTCTIAVSVEACKQKLATTTSIGGQAGIAAEWNWDA